MSELRTYPNALQEILAQRAEIQAYKQKFTEAADLFRPESYSGNTHEESFAAIREALDREFIQPIANSVKVLQNTADYRFGTDGSVRYDTLTGGGDSSFSAYLANARTQVNGNNLKDADYAVLSHLAYSSKFASSQEYQEATKQENISVKEYCESLLKTGGSQMSDVDRTFLTEMANSERYGGMTIGHNVTNTGDGTLGEHTAVLIFECGDGHAVAAVQGTNGTVEDWQNNAQFIGAEPGAEEMYVASIINGYAGEYDSIDLTGHSQGGREATTAGMLMSPENQAKIGRIVSNDGPGYSAEFQARYADQIAAIEGRTTNIRPSSSYVGELMNPVGRVVYVETINVDETKGGSTKTVNSHLSNTWYMDEYGNYYIADGHDVVSLTTIAQITPAMTDLLSVVLPPERTEYYLNEIIGMCDDGNGKLSFGALISAENLGRLKDLGSEFLNEFNENIDKVAREQLTEQQYTLMKGAEMMADYLDKIDGYMDKAENIVHEIGASIPPPYGEVVIAIFDGVHLAVKIAKYAFKVIEYGLKLYAMYKAYKKKKAREAYIAANDSMFVTTAAIREAADALRAAARYINQAYQDYDRMVSNCVGKISKFAGSLFTDDEEKNEALSLVPKFIGKAHCLKYGVHNFDYGGPTATKSAADLDEIASMSESILGSSGSGGGGDSVFDVTPRALSAAGARGAGQATLLKGKTTDTWSDVKSLSGSWEGDDYTALAAYAGKLQASLDQLPDVLESAFNNLVEIAGAYSNYQNQVIEKFQNSQLDFY